MAGNLFPRLGEFRAAFDKQANFMADTHRFVGVVASARSGKTHTSAPKFLARVQATQAKFGGRPLEYWIITPTAELAAPIKIKLAPLIPHSAVDWVRQGKDMQFFNIRIGGGSLILRNGAIIRFKSFEQGESLVAATVGGIWVDECARCNDVTTWGNLRTRLATTRGWMLLSTSPAAKGEFYHGVYLLNRNNPEWSWHSWDAYDAARGGVLPLDEIESARAGMLKHVFEREFLASWSNAIGHVYTTFSEQDNVAGFLPDLAANPDLDPFPTRHVVGLDTGASHPTVLCIVRERAGHFQVLEERRFMTPSLSSIVREVQKLDRLYHLDRVYYDYAPGGAFFAREWVLTPNNNRKSLVIPAHKNIMDGISHVFQAFADKRLTIHSSCVTLIEELSSLRWDMETHREAVIKEADDGPDALRYAISTHTLLYGATWNSPRMTRRYPKRQNSISRSPMFFGSLSLPVGRR